MSKLQFEFQESVNSTNNILKSNRSEKEGKVLIASEQLQGKGMGANQWESVKGENITGSIVLEPTFLHPVQAFLISKSISYGIIEFLTNLEIKAKIKWPNDIYVNNKKLAGILIENEFTSKQISRTISGIGLNVNQSTFEFAVNPTSIKLITGKTFDIKPLTESLFNEVYKNYETLRSNPNGINERYHERLLGLDKWLEYRDKQGVFIGKVDHVADDGQITIIDRSNAIRRYYFKEVEMLF